MTKKFISVFMVIMVLLCIVPTVLADDRIAYPSEEDVEFPPINLSKYEEDDSTQVIVTRASFQVIASSLATGKYASSSEYSINGGVDKLKVTFTWSPAANTIKIGYLNKQGTFYCVTKSGGLYSGIITTDGVPSGQYKVSILNPTSNTQKLSGTAVCEWTK